MVALLILNWRLRNQFEDNTSGVHVIREIITGQNAGLESVE